MKKSLGNPLWNKYHTFGVVRNPYDRLLSNFKYIQKLKVHHLHSVYDDFNDFEEFVLQIRSLDWKDYQHYYLTESGKILVNDVLKFEHLENDFARLTAALKLADVNLKQHNPSERKKDFMSYFNDKMIRVVNEVYADDFTIFGYKKIEP